MNNEYTSSVSQRFCLYLRLIYRRPFPVDLTFLLRLLVDQSSSDHSSSDRLPFLFGFLLVDSSVPGSFAAVLECNDFDRQCSTDGLLSFAA